jgi:Ras-related protein Rab-6A
MEEESYSIDDLMKLKLIVVGNQGTGKSCILNRFVNETFEENYQATIGLDFQSKNVTIHDQDVRLILYDTAGQEKFRSLIPMYIREAQIILLIYDITDRESFDSMPKWIQEVLQVKNSEAVFVLIGNKIDLEDKRQISSEEGKKFAEENNYIFQEVSAKTGDNFEKLFEVQIFEGVYNKFKNECDKREKMEYNDGNNDQGDYENNNDNSKYNKDIKVKLGSKNNDNKKKRKRCC